MPVRPELPAVVCVAHHTRHLNTVAVVGCQHPLNINPRGICGNAPAAAAATAATAEAGLAGCDEGRGVMAAEVPHAVWLP